MATLGCRILNLRNLPNDCTGWLRAEGPECLEMNSLRLVSRIQYNT